MQALFVELPPFQRHRSTYMDDTGFLALQVMLLRNPTAGELIQKAGGLRKVRFADLRRQKGKRGGLRVIYYWWSGGAQFWLFTVYGKDEQDDLSADMLIKRDIFAELTEGCTALADERNGKATLRSHKVRLSELAAISADELVAIRERLNMSRPVFAMYLRTNVRTLENWEQGRAKPNAQATTLIRLVEKYPETVEHLAALA
ncbi:hypothetical protein G6F57_016538 [Rhizopus arrhizus]|nr:hypothetical protein G6F57_016538 [Rhizopus arrhizus]